MRRVLAIVALGVVAIVLVALVVSSSGDGKEEYKVRAVFNNATNLIKGEDVKVAGAKVGVVESLEVTDDLRAAAVLKIDEPAFQDFRKDAECEIRLQSLIGERLVECKPTVAGGEDAPALEKIPDGQDGEGQYLLPVENTITPVGEDLIRNVMRRPFRERFSIILSEFGAGLAARGGDLRKVIRGADPALRNLDRWIKILRDQNKILAEGAKNGDKVLAEWAKERKAVANTIVSANKTAQATAERRVDLERNFERFPAFLRQLTPTMARLGALADQMTPVFRDLGAVGPEVSRLITAIAPFSRAAIPAFRSLGQTADVAGPALVSAGPTIKVLGQFTAKARSVSSNAAALLTSLDQTKGIQHFMEVIYNVTLSSNGFDQFGHYLRTVLLAGCNSLQAVPPQNLGCTANFIEGAGAATATTSSRKRTPLQRILQGEDPSTVLAEYKRRHNGKLPERSGDEALRKLAASQGAAPAQTSPGAAQQPRPDTPTAPEKPKAAPDEPVLDYLLGGGG